MKQISNMTQRVTCHSLTKIIELKIYLKNIKPFSN